MAKDNVITIDGDKLLKGLENLNQKDVEIKSASLKDALCSYSYELVNGVSKGDTLVHRGAHIIHDDLENAMNSLDVFFAHLDDAFTGIKNSTPLSDLEQDVDVEKYHVTGFTLSGVEENKSIILQGWKEVTEGIVKYPSPKIKISSKYVYLTEFIERINNVIDEVEQYRNGKTAPQPEQIHMTFAEEDDSFDKGKVE